MRNSVDLCVRGINKKSVGLGGGRREEECERILGKREREGKRGRGEGLGEGEEGLEGKEGEREGECRES